jgi:addiction module HigA family antidote
VSRFDKYRGIHPGIVLERELEKRAIKQRPFALSICEHPQTFNAIIKGKRGISTALALKIEQALSMEEGTLLILQAFYDIRMEKERHEGNKPNLSLLRRSLFWDTDIDKIDWNKQYKAIFRRVFERGNEREKEELVRFYGKAKMRAALASPQSKPFHLHRS